MRFCLILISTFFMNKIFAWGDMGHQTVGEIANRHLTPQALQAVTDILGAEKMGFAAIWPDAVRSDKDFDKFKPYHYADQASGKSYKEIPETAHAQKDAVTILKKYPGLLTDPNVERSVKMIALRYLIHIVGDVHQPLHVGNGLDAGGNLCSVLWNANDSRTSNLHSVWDSNIVGIDVDDFKKGQNIPYYSFVNYADDLLKKRALTQGELKDLQTGDFYQWMDESQKLRAEVYPDTSPVTNEADRAYCGSETNPTKKVDAPKVLTDVYKNKAKEITEARIVAGGVRLAGLLNQIFKNGVNPGPNTSLTKEQIINKLLLTNY